MIRPDRAVELARTAASFACRARLEDAPTAVRARLRAQAASSIACAMAADGQPDVAALTAWATRAEGPHPVLGARGVSAPRLESIVASFARARAGDWDDFALLGRVGAAAVVVPIVLGAPSDLPWRDVEAAQLAAVEIGARVGLSRAFLERRGHGLVDEPDVHAVVAAVAASRVLRLDEARTADAILRAFAGAASELSPMAGVVAAELAFEGHAAATPRALNLAPGLFDALGRAWFAETITPKVHAAPACAQTAVDAAHEVAAQARAVKKRPLAGADVATVHIETTVLGASRALRSALVHATLRGMLGAAEIEAVRPRTRVVHAWELTSELLWHVGGAIDPDRLFGDGATRKVALAPLELRKLLAHLDVEGPGVAHLAGEVARVATALGRRNVAPLDAGVRGLSLPLATRVTVTLRDGTRLRAERDVPRGSPSSPVEEARSISRGKLLVAAEPRLGLRGAERLASMLLDPPSTLTVRQVLAAMDARR